MDLLIKTADLTAGFLAKQYTPAIKSIWKNEEEIKRFADTVEHIRCVLSDVNGKQFQEQSVNYGYKRLREVFLDAEDFLDRVETRRKKREFDDAKLKEEKEDIKKMDGKAQRFVARCQVQRKSISNKVTRGCSIYNPANAMKVNNEIEEIKKALEDTSKVMRDFRFKEATIVPNVTHHARGSGSRVIATEVMGRERDQNEIVNLLLAASDDEKAIRAVSIVGMGGMGKTTLAQLVFNDIKSQEGCKFDRYMWASDCKKFELKVLLKDLILSSDSNANLNYDGLDYLNDQFVERICGKKVFIVLDDVEIEDPNIWNNLRLLLIKGNMEESRILVTARSKEVARRIGANSSIHELKGLSKDDSWSLFERCANLSGNKNREKLIEIGKGIVERCAGVPLAIKVIGSYLETESISTWEYVRDFEWKDEKISIIPILKISYDGLDSTLKQCFSLCALFPKNWTISFDILSNIWITYVRFKAEEGITLKKICSDKLKILCERFFLEDVGGGSCFKMHDLMHDLSTNVAGEEILVVEDLKSVVDPNKLVLEKNVRHLTLNHGRREYDGTLSFERKRTLSFEPKGRGLRTFLQVTRSMDPHLRSNQKLSVEKLVTTCPVLRVLDLNHSGIEKLTDSIGKLIHLRFLDISGNAFETLPDSFTKLINLRYLNLAFCFSLTCLPCKIDALTSLEKLDLFCCRKLVQLPTAIVKLPNLKNLGIKSCDALNEMPSGFGALTGSTFLVGRPESKHSAQLEELGHFPEVKEGRLVIEIPINVAVKGQGDGEAYLLNKKWLRDLEILWKDKREEDTEVETAEKSSCCTPLFVRPKKKKREEDTEVETAENHIDILAKLQPPTNLKTFHLNGYPGMTFPPWVPKGSFASALPNLVEMRLSGCGKCRHLPPLSRLPCLRSLILEELRSLEYIEEENNIASTTSFCPCLKQLTLYKLPELKAWCRGLDNCDHQQSLMLLPSFPQLNRMFIQSCSNLRVSLLLLSFGKVFDSSQTSSLTFFDQVLRNSGWYKLFLTQESDRHVWNLLISNFNSTESTSIYMDEAFRVMSDRVTHLTITDCSGLKTLPRGLQHLTALQELAICDCPNFTWEDDDEQSLEHQQTSSDGEMSRKPLESLQVLKLWNLPMMVRLPKWIQLVTSLTEVSLYKLPRMETLPEWIQLLTNLQVLKIESCPNLIVPECVHNTFENKSDKDASYSARFERRRQAR